VPGPPTPGAVDRTGVSPTEIRIGVHVPITGAAPVPQDFEKYVTLYARWLADRGGIHGRNLRILVRDDQLNPSRAVQVCRELVEVQKVFLLVGISPNEASACARYAERMGVPYLSASGADAGLGKLATYFALSMSYPQQSPMLVQLIRRLGKSKLGILVADPPNLDDTYESFSAAARSGGLTVVRSRRVKEKGDDAESVAEATALRQAGAEVVYVAGPPALLLKLAHAAQGQAYNPQWIGPGPTAGFNLVAEVGCPSIGAAKFLSPIPQLDVIDRYDPDFRPASHRYNGEEPSDLALISWGITKTIAVMLAATGPDLSRQSLLTTIQSGREFASGVYAPVRYGPRSRFGARQSHLLEADCQARRFRTVAAFVSEL
jgi:ABC-type branched-subunit amino acid transport system substrate-binding protein